MNLPIVMNNQKGQSGLLFLVSTKCSILLASTLQLQPPINRLHPGLYVPRHSMEDLFSTGNFVGRTSFRCLQFCLAFPLSCWVLEDSSLGRTVL